MSTNNIGCVHLPNEMLHFVFRYLSDTDLIIISLVSKLFKESAEPILLKRLIHRFDIYEPSQKTNLHQHIKTYLQYYLKVVIPFDICLDKISSALSEINQFKSNEEKCKVFNIYSKKNHMLADVNALSESRLEKLKFDRISIFQIAVQIETIVKNKLDAILANSDKIIEEYTVRYIGIDWVHDLITKLFTSQIQLELGYSKSAKQYIFLIKNQFYSRVRNLMNDVCSKKFPEFYNSISEINKNVSLQNLRDKIACESQEYFSESTPFYIECRYLVRRTLDRISDTSIELDPAEYLFFESSIREEYEKNVYFEVDGFFSQIANKYSLRFIVEIN